MTAKPDIVAGLRGVFETLGFEIGGAPVLEVIVPDGVVRRRTVFKPGWPFYD